MFMKRLLEWIFGLGFRRNPATVVDLPKEFGPWLTQEEVRAALRDEGGKRAVTAMVQLLWRRRSVADEAARGAGAMGRGEGALFHLGAMELVNDVMIDLKALRTVSEEEEEDEDTERLRREVAERESAGSE
jgi:hypothetical protein